MLGPVELLAEVDSTNRVMLDRARAGADHGLVLVADHQTAGRGRLDRRWDAAQGSSLLVSVLLRPDLEPSDSHLLTFAAGLAGVDACRLAAGVDVGLKWPNDLVVEGTAGTRKLAGLLAESVLERGQLSAVVIGMGLNLRAGTLPSGIGLDELSGPAVHRDRMLDIWLDCFEIRLAQIGTEQLLRDYRSASTTIGRDVRVELGTSSIEGRAIDVAVDGRLVLECAGHRQAIASGDVVHLRLV